MVVVVAMVAVVEEEEVVVVVVVVVVVAVEVVAGSRSKIDIGKSMRAIRVGPFRTPKKSKLTSEVNFWNFWVRNLDSDCSD